MARFLESGHEVILMDGAEILEALPSDPRVRKVPAMFPKCPDVLRELAGTCDAVIVYSAFQYVFVEGNPYEFLDEALRLLAPGGELLLGDIPNVSMRKRFLASDNGRQFHRQYTKVDEDPEVAFNCAEPGLIDDGVVFGLLLRARMAGFHAYVMPQMAELPMANRREDVLFRRP